MTKDRILPNHTRLTRRQVGLVALALAAAGALPREALGASTARLGHPEPFSWDVLVSRAEQLAREAYTPPVPSSKAVANFDEAVRVTYGPADAIAQRIRLFPASNTAVHPVTIHVVEGGKAQAVDDTAGLFVDGADADPAGFRIMDTDGRTDWLAFLSASYFRTSGSRNQYGLSARAVAIDTGLDGGEEFPAFTEFWVEHLGTDHFLIHALLDGPSLTGAFAFDSRKTSQGVEQDVKAVLFLRKDIQRLGLAPATSMFWYDESTRNAGNDWRPEIHDSDGLAIWTQDGERILRPLSNPPQATVNTFHAESPKGFGLLQRDQAFENYQDDGAFYNRRPNLWVEPAGEWGEGTVLLYEMPTDSETLDNIVAFWTPDAPARAGERRDFAYRLIWSSNDPTHDGIARCVDIFYGPAGIPGAPPIAGARKIVFDFAGPSLAGLDRESGVEAVTSLPSEAVLASSAYPVVGMKDRWRAVLDVRIDALTAPEFRIYLRRGQAALSETVIEVCEQ